MVAYSLAITFKFFSLNGLIILLATNIGAYFITFFRSKALIWIALVCAMRMGDLSSSLGFLVRLALFLKLNY